MKLLYISAFLLISHAATAEVCKLNISATDQMRFEQQTLEVNSQCTEVEVTLHNAGKLPANIMGHDWVLTKTADVASVDGKEDYRNIKVNGRPVSPCTSIARGL